MSYIDIIFSFLILLILIGVAIGRYPVLRMNRATIALVGAVIMVVAGAISLQQAYAAIDMNTIALLFAMMIINVNLHLAGFFQIVTTRVVKWARTPRQLLALTLVASGILSALFLNDTIVLMFTPLILEVTAVLRRNPIPYLIGLVTAANIGSTATIVGNPQNMLIGISSGIPFTTFTGYLAPVAIAGLVLVWLVLVLVYPREFETIMLPIRVDLPVRTYKPLLVKSLIATSLMLIAFLAGAPIPLAALAAAAMLLTTRRLKPQRVFREVDWSLLVFFSGLFIVTGAIETSGLSERMFALVRPLAMDGVAMLTVVSVVLSNLVSNVPAVLLFRPLIPAFPQVEQTWLTLAMATTLAGNLTLLGSVANLIVAESARVRGVHLSFGEYLKAGVPITLLSLVWGVVWLMLIF